MKEELGMIDFLNKNELGTILKLAYIQRAKQKYIWDEKSKYKKDLTTIDGVECLTIYTKIEYRNEIEQKLKEGGRSLVETSGYDDMIRVNLLFDYDITLEFKKI